MDGPREVRAVKVAFILRAFVKRRRCPSTLPRLPAGVVRPGSLRGSLLRRMHPLCIPDERLGSREDLMASHVESREGIKAIRTLVLGLTVREAGECAGLPPVRGPLVRVERRRDLPRDHGHHLFDRRVFRG